MRVLRVIGGLEPAFGGPSFTVVASAIAVARAPGVTVELTFPARDPATARNWPSVRALEAGGVAVSIHRLMPGRLARSLGCSLALARHLRRRARAVDIVHADGAWVHASLAAVRAAGAAGRPAVLTPHEGFTRFDMARARLPMLRWLKVALRRWYMRRLAAVAYSSELERADSDDGGATAAQRVVIAHPVWDDSVSRPAPRRFGAVDAGRLRVGFLGRLHPKKNLDLLIAALARLPSGVTLAVAGDGPPDYVGTLHAQAASLGVAARVDWRGFLSGRARDDFLAGIDLLVMPSAYECFGMVAAEAMASGTPVLVSSATGVAEALAPVDPGLVVTPDVAALAGALTPLVADRGRLDRMAEAAVRAGGAYSYAEHGRRQVALYRALVATDATAESA
ncbi:MAG: glycosyltransferase family 4 protein [Alphaproteobacteria bacterium]